MPLGSAAIVLHGHMPWVLHHGRWPHGEHWLYEAALEVYLPLLDLISELQAAGIAAKLTLGLTPVLLEQLAHPTFQQGFTAYLAEQLARAREDERDPSVAELARYWQAWLRQAQARWEAAGGDIGAAFAAHARAGRIELLTSLATHGYAPLILHDSSIRGQLRAGQAVSRRRLGADLRGLWLPECAFRPAGPWTPPLLHGDARNRAGVDQILGEGGISHFFVDAHLFAGIRSEGVIEAGRWRKVDWQEAEKYPGRGWRSVMEPHLVSTVGGPAQIAAFARHPRVSEQVWSADSGYPGDGAYLEFHKKRDGDGLRYWRVTRRDAGLGEKQPYRPQDIPPVVHRQARHFATTIRQSLQEHRALTGREGIVVAPFDAELFGHWWHEGPRWLRDVILTLHHDGEVVLQTASERLQTHPPDKVGWLPEGSWGAGGDHHVWLNDGTRWAWEAAYRAEDRLHTLLWERTRVPPERAGPAEDVLRKAARELLLLQASDWAFVVHTRGAVDYGFRRLAGHLTRFENLANLAHDLLQGRAPTPLQRVQLAEADAHDDCFPDLDLAWWS